MQDSYIFIVNHTELKPVVASSLLFPNAVLWPCCPRCHHCTSIVIQKSCRLRYNTDTFPYSQRLWPTHRPLMLSVWGRRVSGSLHSGRKCGAAREDRHISTPSWYKLCPGGEDLPTVLSFVVWWAPAEEQRWMSGQLRCAVAACWCWSCRGSRAPGTRNVTRTGRGSVGWRFASETRSPLWNSNQMS